MLSAGTYNTSLNASSIPSGSSWNNTTKIIGAGANGGTRFVTPSGGRGIYAFSTISYIEFSDLEFDGSSGGDDGLKFDANNIAHIKFTRIRTHNYAGQGIAINSPSSETISDIQFFQVESHNNGYASDQCNNRPGYCHGMYVNARDMIIDGAKLHDNNGLGIQIYPGPTDNPIMRNSLIYNNYNWGLFVADTVTNGKIYNNTIYGNRNNYGLAYWRSDWQVRNNIGYNNDQSITTSCTQSNNLTSNPKFVNAGAGDFHLQSNSSAIKAGYNVGSAVPTDKDGVSRPQGSAYDIGAYEYTGVTTNPAPTISLTASPTSITSGTASTLTWSSTNATSCTASGAWSGTKSTSGSQSTGNLTANSTFTLSCTGTGGTTNQSVTVNVTAPIAFNFTLSHGGNKSVTQGSSVTNSVTATLSSGTSQSTGFAVSGLPTGATASFSPTACSPTCSSTLTINTLSTTPTGNSTVTITATGGSVIKTSTFTLTVNAPTSTKFSINDRVQVNATFVNVRATANGTLLGTQTTNALGTVIGGPTNTGGYNWWNINFDTGFDGWSAEDYLVKYVAPTPTPTPTPSPTPTPTPTQTASGTIILDNFSGPRLNSGTGGDIFYTYLGEDPGQTYSITNGQMRVTGSPTVGIYWHFLPYPYTGSLGWAKGWIEQGTWDANVNRLKFSFSCDRNLGKTASGYGQIQVGTYVKP